jgi:mannitol-1-phosphate 5-dehydrogenase
VRAVIIGPGRIGLGFAGELLDRADAKLTFVGRSDVVENLRHTGRYRVRLVDQAREHEREIRVPRALFGSDVDAVAAEIARARVVCVAVGPQNLGAIAPLIAAGLEARARKKPLNVIAFENALDAGPNLRAAVAERLPSGFPLKRHGFSGAIVSRVVSRRVGDPADEQPLTLLGDPYETFEVHRRGLRKPLPEMPGMARVKDYEAAFNRKLYVLSTGHATVAYLGFLKGYRFVHAAVRDPEIRTAALEAMREGQRGLAARYGKLLAGGEAELQAILWRFENAALNDPVVRVGRDPGRKLSPGERLVGPAQLCEAAGTPTAVLPVAAAAALCFAAAGDPAGAGATAQHLSGQTPTALQDLCAMQADSGFSQSVTAAWERFSRSWRRDAPLFSLSTRKSGPSSGSSG